ncbi:MAG: TusE/DsrC/DsvC family sulfur relay protein, partial [Rhodothermales bacterium]
MAETMIAGSAVDLNSEGYLTNPAQWTPDVAHAIAQEEEIELSDLHFSVINYLREQFENDARLTIRRIGKSGIVTIKEFYGLFPGGPLKKASRIAGIPKPA